MAYSNQTSSTSATQLPELQTNVAVVQLLDGGDDIARVERGERPPTAFFVGGGGVIDIAIMGIGEMTH